MPTIREVADLAGVAVGTVSHVVNGSVPVSEALRRKVQDAIRELDYHPNHVARSLKTSKTRTLGIIVPDMTISFFPKVIRGAETAARERGYSLMAVNSDENGERQRELLSLLRSQRVEGVLLVIAAAPTPVTQISRMIDAGMRLVCLDRIPDRVPVDSVSVEDSEAAELGVDHLIAMGHRRIAITTGPQTLKNERQRLLGYKQSLERAGLVLDNDFIWTGNNRPEDVGLMCRGRMSAWGRMSAGERMRTGERMSAGERMRNGPGRPDAIFATNGPTGLGVLRALRDAGLSTPEDIAFVTFDELTVDDLFKPAITTVVQPAYDIGFRAAEILLQRIEEGLSGTETITVRLPAKLHVRDSSGLPIGSGNGRNRT